MKAAGKVAVSLGPGGKKGASASKGIEHDAMGIKWNKSMWDNMESKCDVRPPNRRVKEWSLQTPTTRKPTI